jgi:hypothetical protein
MWRHSFIATFFILLFVTAQSQLGSSNVFEVLNRIRAVPSWYIAGYNSSKTKGDKLEGIDTVYADIVKLDTIAIPKLIPFLSDTTYTEILNTCTGGYFTFGQLAFFLINDIEPVPYFLVTKSRWDAFGECWNLPIGFLGFLRINGSNFKDQYSRYINSKERQDWLKQNKKRNKKKGRNRNTAANIGFVQ